MENNKITNIIDLMETDLYDLDLQYGTVCCLKNVGLKNIIDVLRYRNNDETHNNLKDIRLFGETKEKYLNSKLLEYGIDYNDKKQRQELIDEYNIQKSSSNNNETPKVETDNMNKVGIETDLYDLDLPIKVCNSLKRAGINTVYDILKHENLKSVRRLGEKGLNELQQKLLEYGIDLNDSSQCENLKKENDEKTIDELEKEYYVTLYKSEGTFEELRKNGYETLLDEYQRIKSGENKDITKQINIEKIKPILETMIEDLNLTVYSFNILKRAGINIILDLIRRDSMDNIRYMSEKRIKEIKEKLLEYGIDFDDKEQCRELIKRYEDEKEKQKNQITVNKKESELLNQVTNDNDSLENELTRKQKVLQELKEQLERRKQLEQQLAECDKEYSELINQYNTLNSKESSNNYGTK